ncbi:ABC transporter substrate-binding protein [Pseudochelatococcus sp. B33]
MFHLRSFWKTGLALCAGLLSANAMAADQALIDAAKKEGEVTWYTTQIIDQFARPVSEAFEKKYGIRVNYVRTNSTEATLRIMNEGRASSTQADVFDGTGGVSTLKREGLVAQWVPEASKSLPPEYVDKEGYWVATNLYAMTPGFNTELVEKGTEPQTLQDLLDPKWRGKLVWNSNLSSSGAAGFVGMVLSEMGEEKGMAYLRDLAQQNVAGLSASARQVLDQVIAGEYAIALNIFNHHTVISANKGVPVMWIPMQPALVFLSYISLTKDAPHPNAGKLFMEFLISEEGQKLYREADYLPVHPNVEPKDPSLRPDGETLRVVFKTPEELDANLSKWANIHRELFR